MQRSGRMDDGGWEGGMRMADRISPQWVIKEVTYFDHATHRFVAGDIEIAGERIIAIKAPGASTHPSAFDARAYVCTPGLVVMQAAPHALADESENMLRSGITTAGTLCTAASECIASTSRARVRLITRLLLNPLARARSQQRRPDARAHAPELHALGRIEALVRRNAGRLALAEYCPSIVSAYELAYAQNLAAELQLELGFVLSGDELSARAFRDRFYRSETHLLDFMQLLHPGTTVWGTSQLTRNDIEILAASGAHVSGFDAASLLAHRTQTGAYAMADSAGADAGACAGDATVTPFATLLGAPHSFADADRCVDAATVAAAAALGEHRCGRIEPGMRADLCLFSSPKDNLLGLGSDAFVRLFECGRPDVVVVAGATKRNAAGNRADASAAHEHEHRGARACPQQARGASSINSALL